MEYNTLEYYIYLNFLLYFVRKDQAATLVVIEIWLFSYFVICQTKKEKNNYNYQQKIW